MKLEHGTPMDIEGESMRIIREELEAQGIVLPPDRAAVVLRAIHTRRTSTTPKTSGSPPGRWRRGWPP